MSISPATLIPRSKGIGSPLALRPTFWLRPDDGVYTGGSRTLKSANKSGFSAATFAAVNLGTGDVLIAFWANRSATGNQVIFDKYQDSDNYYRLEFNSSHKLHFIAKVSGTTKVEITSTTAYSTTGVWLHGLIAIDRSAAATTKVYVNGADDTAGTSTTSTDSIDNTGTFYVGQSGATTLFLAGSIASLGIAKPTDVTTVAASAATSLYNLGNSKSYAELTAAEVAAWNVTWWANCNEQDPTTGLTDQHSTNDLARLANDFITGGAFTAADGTSPPTGWTNYATWPWDTCDIQSNKMRLLASGSNTPANCSAYQQVALLSGESYVLSYEATRTSGTLLVSYNDDRGGAYVSLTEGYSASHSASATVTNFAFTPTASNGYLCFSAHNYPDALSWTVDGVSIKSAGVAVGNGPAECCATNSGSGSGLDGKFVGVSAAGLITNWRSDVPTPLAGQGGYSFLFDGSDDALVLASDPVGTGAATIACWVKKTDAYDARLFDNGKCLFIILGDGGFVFYSNAINAASTAASLWGLNTWCHIVATRTAAGVTNLYFNAALSGSADQNSGSPVAASTAAVIANRAAYDRAFKGNLDDFRVYDSVLSPAQIAQLYAGQEATGATPVGHWKFDDGPFGVPSDGDPLWGWESQDGYRYQFVNATNLNRPVQRVAGIGGRPAVEGDGVNDIMRAASIVGMSVANPTFAVVCRPDDVILGTPAIQALMAVQDEGSVNNFVFLGISADGKFTVQGNKNGTGFTVTGDTVLSDTTNYILLAYWDGSNWQLLVNGAAQTETRTGTEVIPASISGLDSTTLFGRYSNAVASNWFDGRIAEPFAGTLTAGRKDQLIRHWKRRYAIA